MTTKKRTILNRVFAVTCCAAGLTTASAAAVELSKPAVLFLSRPMQQFYGGSYLKQNMARLDRAGYRVAYYEYPELYRKPAGTLQKFDAVVILQYPALDTADDPKKVQDVTVFYAGLRKLLSAGGGALVFLEPGPFAMRSLWPFFEPSGLSLSVGCFADQSPTLGVFEVAWFAHTPEVSRHPLTEGVRGVWYPVAGKLGTRFNYDSLRNANTTPFDVDRRWSVLLRAGSTTSYALLEGKDSAFLAQPQFQHRPADPAPLVAVREGAEGSGRLAVCGINAAYSDFLAGNSVYGGVCTGKGLDGKPSDLDRLLMQVLDWLGEPSRNSGRATIRASVPETFAVAPYQYPPPLKVDGTRPLRPNTDQFRGLVGARSVYSGGRSTVAEYAKAARGLGLDFLVFLEEFASLRPADFDRLQEECRHQSDSRLLLIPGIRIQNSLGIHYFGFRLGMTLPQPSQLKPGTRLLTQQEGGQVEWAVANGGREEMACGNFRLDVKEPLGIPASDYNCLNPFIAVHTYQGGRLADTMLDVYLKCAARTEWVSPIAVQLVDSAEQLVREWRSDHFRTVWLRDPGQGLEGFRTSIGERYAYAPVSYVTNGPRIEEWRSNNFDSGGGFWDWTRYRWFVKLAVSSDAGLKEIRVLDGTHEIRRFLPGGARRFEHLLVLTHVKMQNLILVVTDIAGRQAVSDEEWDKNQLLQLTWCADRNNMLSYAALPAPKSSSGSTAGNYPAPWSLDKGGFRENLVPAVNQDRSRLPGFDGQPYYVADVSPAPAIRIGVKSEGGARIARDIGRDLCSPDVAIQTAACRLTYDPAVARPHPWTRGPLVPMEMFHADLRYITFSHGDHLVAPVILEGRLKTLQKLKFSDKVPLGVSLATMSCWRRASGYKAFAIQHSRSGDHAGMLAYDPGEPTPRYAGAFPRGAYGAFYPSPFGAVALLSLDDRLSYEYSNGHLGVGYATRAQTIPAGTQWNYRLLVLAAGFDELPTTDWVENFRDQFGLGETGKVGYQVTLEHGAVRDRQYVLTLDGQGTGFAGEIVLPPRFPASLPIVVENLNDRWTCVLYDRDGKRMRPLGTFADAAYCHRAPDERRGRILIGHPFTLDRRELWLSVVQTGLRELTLQIHNSTDQPMETTVSRNPLFDLVLAQDFQVRVPAGQTVERVVGRAEGK
jgi:hypothetical protein